MGYPAHREADVVLRDGSTVRVRPARPEDAQAVERLLSGLSDRSRWLQYFSGGPNIDKVVQSVLPDGAVVVDARVLVRDHA